MPNNITPEATIIELNHIRTDKGERPPEIDMAIRAINRCFVKRKPLWHLIALGICPTCNTMYMEDTFDYCTECGQALDWSGGDSDGRNKQ